MLSVVVPAYNEEKNIHKCLGSLAAQTTKLPFEVIVVDNNSNDNTAKVAKTFAHKLSLRIVLEKQKGRGAARAAGFKQAKGDIILSTDADTVVPQTWIDSLLKPFADPHVVAVTGPGYVDDLSAFANLVSTIFNPIFMFLYRVGYGHYWLSGFNFAIRKSVYDKTKGFDPTLNAIEDIDLSFQVQPLGHIAYVNTSVGMSGRRLRSGLIKGVLSYVKEFRKYRKQSLHEIEMSDIR